MQLRVLQGPDSEKQLLIYPGKSYYIGRDPAYCQLILTDDGVSRKHAVITSDEQGQIVLSDNDSQNGTFVQGARITKPVTLNLRDRITIGDNVLELQISAITNQQEAGSVYSAQKAKSKQPLKNHGMGSVTTIGRDASNTVTLDHPHVSRQHAVIEITDQGAFIRDLKSTNGTYVDGVRVAGSHPIYRESVIRISGFRLTMEDFEVIKHDETAGQVELDVRDLSKVITLPTGEERVILNNLCFRIEPREFVAILGGSGAGKSTLLKAMMGTWPATFGEMLINGTNYYEEYGAFKSMIGYVPQDDIVHMELSVEEVLSYAARLRMPDDTLPQEREMRIEEVMQSLGLSERRTTLVKDLSGGQRKRVSIGVELITKPSIMFLDEPTSGLDPGLEKVMMEMMRNMANQGQTIILVTHATFNIHLCDKVIFLTEGGRLAFFGTPQEALAYFGTDDFAEIYKMINVDKSPEQWQYDYSISSNVAKYQPRGCSGSSAARSLDTTTRRSSFKQWYNLSCRYAKTVIRDKKNLMIILLQPIIIASLISIVFLGSAPVFEKSPLQHEDVELTDSTVIEGRLEEVNNNIAEESKRQSNMKSVILAFAVSAIWCGASNSAREIVKEIFIYKRERFVNIRIAPYLMSKTAIQSALSIIQALLFVSIISFVLSIPNFWLNVLAFFLIALSSALMGLAVSAFASNANVATSTLPILLIPQFVMAGAIVPIDAVEPEFLQVIFYVVVGKWGYELIGGHILDINSLLAFDEPIEAFKGSLEVSWWIIAGFCVAFYLLSTAGMLSKDKDLS